MPPSLLEMAAASVTLQTLAQLSAEQVAALLRECEQLEPLLQYIGGTEKYAGCALGC